MSTLYEVLLCFDASLASDGFNQHIIVLEPINCTTTHRLSHCIRKCLLILSQCFSCFLVQWIIGIGFQEQKLQSYND